MIHVEAHKHDDCMPSLTVKEDGTLLLSSEDLVDGNVDCLAQAFRDLFCDVRIQLMQAVSFGLLTVPGASRV